MSTTSEGVIPNLPRRAFSAMSCSSQKFYVCSMKTAGSMVPAKCGDNFVVKVSMWRAAP